MALTHISAAMREKAPTPLAKLILLIVALWSDGEGKAKLSDVELRDDCCIHTDEEVAELERTLRVLIGEGYMHKSNDGYYMIVEG